MMRRRKLWAFMIEREVRFIDWIKLNGKDTIFMCLIFEHVYFFYDTKEKSILKQKKKMKKFSIFLTDLQSRLNSSFYNFQHQTKIDFFPLLE